MSTVDLFTGPWYSVGNKQAKKPTVGPVVVGLKRTVSRIRPDLVPWTDFDPVYNRRLAHGLAVIQRDHDILGTGQVGEKTFRLLQHLHRQGHPHELAMDNVAIHLFEDEWARKHPPELPIQKVYDAIVEYWEGLLTYAEIWHYLQRRAMTTLGRAPHAGGRSDCSEATTASKYWARLRTGVYVPDPNNRGFDGYGNTDTIWATNRVRRVYSGQYLVGDNGIYGPEWRTRHVVECIVAGTSSTAVWGSNGSESAPNEVRLFYRGDLLGVVRPILIPANH